MAAPNLLARFANILGPQPPSPDVIAVLALAFWLVPLWSIDRHRDVTLS